MSHGGITTASDEPSAAKTSDKAAAERIGDEAGNGRGPAGDGCIDATLDAIGQQSRRPIESHLADYQAKLHASGRDDKHVDSTLAYIRAVTTAAGFTTVADITADGVNQFADDLKAKGKSARTIQAYLTAAKGFTRWLAANHKLPRDPLASVQQARPQGRQAARTPDAAAGRMAVAKACHSRRPGSARNDRRGTGAAVRNRHHDRVAVE